MERLSEHDGAVKTFGWIDSMSITQVVQAFEVWPKSSSPYGWNVPRDATVLLICTDNISLVPGLSAGRIVSSGPIGTVTRELIKSDVLSRPDFPSSVRKLAIIQAQQRINRYCDRVRNDYRGLSEGNPEDVREWMDWSIRSAWVEHAQNFGSLIDAEFIPQLARILDVTKKDMLDLQKLTSSLDVVRDFVTRQPDTDAFNMTYNCFLLGALLRGLYHNYLARQSGQQVAHHPFREVLLPKTATQPLLYEETNVESYLANIVLHSALLEKNPKSRLTRWADNIRRIRAANRPGYEEIDLRPKEDPDLAKSEAIRAAKTLGIDVHPWWFEEVVNATLALGVLGGTFLLHPFAGIALGVTEYVASRKIAIGKRVARGIYARRGRLSRLAESPPGRITRLKIDN